MNQSTTQRMKMFAAAAMLIVVTNNAMAAGELISAINLVYGAIITIATIWAIIVGWGGIHKIQQGDPSGKMAIFAAVLIFVIPLIIMAIVTKIFPGFTAPTADFGF